MRKLYLVNEVGTTYYLDYRNNTLIESLDGFGFDFNIEYQDFADKFVENKRKVQQRIINVTLLFLEGYEGFTIWREFITNTQKMRIYYYAAGLNYCYVNVKSTSKVARIFIIRSSVSIECLSLWLVDKTSD